MAPAFWLLSSVIRSAKKTDKTVNWKGPALLWAIILLISVGANIYISSIYNLDFFHNSYINWLIIMYVIGSLVLVFSFANIAATLAAKRKNAPEGEHNPKTMWKFIGVSTVLLFVFLAWVHPIEQKTQYALNLHQALKELDTSDDQSKEFSLVLIKSNDECFGGNCSSTKYENLYYVKNNMDKKKEVEFTIAAYNSHHEKMTEIDSRKLTIGAGDLAMLTTDETKANQSVWSQFSFQTDEEINNYEYKYHYRDVT